MDTAHQSDAHDAIPGLPNHVVERHVLDLKNIPDPADLARLQTVSRAMRDAVAATGRMIEPMGWQEASKLGCQSALQRLQRQGEIPVEGKIEVFRWASYRGDLELMKWAHENDFPMDERWAFTDRTMQSVVTSERENIYGCGNIRVLKWLRANDPHWNDRACEKSAESAYRQLRERCREAGEPWGTEPAFLEALRWYADGCPM